MTDYQGNSKKNKETKPVKKIERVTRGEVLIPKPTVGSKLKEAFFQTTLRSVSDFVLWDVMVPSIKSMLMDALSGGGRRMMYGDRVDRAGLGGSRTTYNRPVDRSRSIPYDNLDRRGLGKPEQRAKGLEVDFVLSSRDEAELVIERMLDILENDGVVTIGDLHQLVGYDGSTYVDEKWGWNDLHEARVQEMREGYLVDLPRPVSI